MALILNEVYPLLQVARDGGEDLELVADLVLAGPTREGGGGGDGGGRGGGEGEGAGGEDTEKNLHRIVIIPIADTTVPLWWIQKFLFFFLFFFFCPLGI